MKNTPQTTVISEISKKYLLIKSHLNERGRRIWAATEAKALGYGGRQLVNRATGLAFATIGRGMLDLEEEAMIERVRKGGGGRKKKVMTDPLLKQDIEKIVDSSTRGDPESPLLWCSKSTRNIAAVLNKESDRVSHTLVSRALEDMGYSLQGNRKTQEGGSNPDRDAHSLTSSTTRSKNIRSRNSLSFLLIPRKKRT